MMARLIDVVYAQEKPQHRARDSVDLRDPLIYAIHRAERANCKSLATREQTLAEMVLRMRLVDPSMR